MKESENKNIDRIGCPLHGFGRRLFVVKTRRVFWREDIDEEGSYEHNEHAGGGVYTDGHHEIVKYKPGDKTYDQQPLPGNGK